MAMMAYRAMEFGFFHFFFVRSSKLMLQTVGGERLPIKRIISPNEINSNGPALTAYDILRWNCFFLSLLVVCSCALHMAEVI